MIASAKLHVVALIFALGCVLLPARVHAHSTAPGSLGPIAHPTAVIYVSPWCGHSGETFRNPCQMAMDQLREADVSFETRDIFDERWRAEYVAKMERLGRRPPAVPLTDIEGVLVLGSHNGIERVAASLRRGETPTVDDEPGYTKPSAPKKPVYRPGTPWVEPPEAPATVYGGKGCVHCPATKKFLKKRNVKAVEVDTKDPKVWEEHQAHMARFGFRGPSVPCVLLYGRFLIGFDDQAIEALVHWRRTSPNEGPASRAPAERSSSKTPAARQGTPG